ECAWCRILKQQGLAFPATFWRDEQHRRFEIRATALKAMEKSDGG
ncbi:unnamed protein product, partial [marine sediment metagenome]